jgi:hypothetical protein
VNPCPKCYAENTYDAVVCRDCKTPLKPAPLTCANGHSMNETWTECAYCRAEGKLPVSSGASAYRPTTVEGAVPPPPPPPKPVDSVATRWEAPPPVFIPPVAVPPVAVPARPVSPPVPTQVVPPAQRKTVYTPAENLSSTIAVPGRQREKIIGILVTYSWKPEGEIFPIREGRNRIGRDAAQCDVVLTHDDTLSSLHASITFRRRFVISDLDSMSGTYVNGVPIEEPSYPLDSYAEIRTGSTVWTFIAIEMEKIAGESGTPPAAEEPTA